MTQKEAAAQIFDHLAAIAIITQQYDKDANYISLTAFIDKNIGIINVVDAAKPLKGFTTKLLR